MWIPCVIDGCKDVEHKCPRCGAIVGLYRKGGLGAARQGRYNY